MMSAPVYYTPALSGVLAPVAPPVPPARNIDALAPPPRFVPPPTQEPRLSATETSPFPAPSSPLPPSPFAPLASPLASHQGPMLPVQRQFPQLVDGISAANSFSYDHGLLVTPQGDRWMPPRGGTDVAGSPRLYQTMAQPFDETLQEATPEASSSENALALAEATARPSLIPSAAPAPNPYSERTPSMASPGGTARLRPHRVFHWRPSFAPLQKESSQSPSPAWQDKASYVFQRSVLGAALGGGLGGLSSLYLAWKLHPERWQWRWQPRFQQPGLQQAALGLVRSVNQSPLRRQLLMLMKRLAVLLPVPAGVLSGVSLGALSGVVTGPKTPPAPEAA